MKRSVMLVAAAILMLAAVNRAEPDDDLADPLTYLEPDTIYLKELDGRAILVHIENERIEHLLLSTIRVNEKIPAYTPEIYPLVDEEDRIITDCFIYRFLSAYRPIKNPPIDTTYTVDYYYGDNMHYVLEGKVVIDFYEGDLNLDGEVDESDLGILTNYLFKQGKACVFEELMDVNGSGRCDIDDISALQDLIQQ
jgi:hypothetical protein